MLNAAIQFFSFDSSRKVLDMMRVADGIVENLPRLNFVFQTLNGVRKSVSVGKLLDSKKSEIRFNEGYLQIPTDSSRPDALMKGIQEILVHFSVSPNCELWRSSKEVVSTPAARHVVARNVESVERAAKNRSPRLMPTVLEITLKTNRTDIHLLLKESSEIVRAVWHLVQCQDKTAVIDIGGEWLFFPKSGYNPNVSDLHVYYSVDSYDSWQTARARHNISFSSDSHGEHLPPVASIHDTALRRQSHT